MAFPGLRWEAAGCSRCASSFLSAVERKPAQLVAQPLIVQHKGSDLAGELSAVPLALQAAGRLPFVLSRCRSRRFDRVGLERGADVGRPNGSGSMPIQLAHWITGRTGSGSSIAKAEQKVIARLLLEHGAG